MSDQPVDAVVAVVLSRLLGEYTGRDGKDLSVVARALLSYGRRDVEPPAIRWTARSGMKARGVTRLELNKWWEKLRFTDHELACFPTELLADLVDPAAWPPLRQMIEDGPRLAARQVETALYVYSQTEVRATVARPGGGTVTRQTVELRREAYRRVMRILVNLRTLEYPASVLDRWMAVPPVESPDIVPEFTDRSGPPLDLVRAVAQRLDHEIDDRLGAVDGNKLATIESLPTVALFQAGVAQRLRHLVTIALLATLAPRISALAAVRAVDYDPQHRFPDATVGPALRFYGAPVVPVG